MKMKSFFLFLSLFLVNLCIGQSVVQGGIYLENYTWTSGSNTVGKIFLKGTPNPVFKLKGSDARSFQIGKNNRLLVKDSKRPKPNGSLLIIETSSNGKDFSDTFLIIQNRFVKNKVIAHRGAWKNTGAAQNSIGSLNHAAQLGCEGSEFDVRLSADNIVVVNHDPHIQELVIDKTASADLLKLKLSNGEYLPTLENYLEAGMKQYTTKLILEIKHSGMDSLRLRKLTEESVSLVRKYKAQAWVDYISFSYNACRQVQELDPSAKVAYLNGDKEPALLAADRLYGLDYNQSVFQKNPDWIDTARLNHLTVNVWTVNTGELMDYFLDRKVDFITTDEPELLLQKIKAKPAIRQ